MMSVIALTGASGFIGSALLFHLQQKGNEVRVFSRQPVHTSPDCMNFSITGIDKDTNYSEGLVNVECVIHCAARVHVMDEESIDPLNDYRAVNTSGTLNLARQASDAGVRRFVFISSIKVSGESTSKHSPYKSNDKPNPVDPYGISKYEAEQGLKLISENTDMDVVIIRPVLVYGPEVKGNFLHMMNWISKGIPLPLGAIYNKRSFVALDNLVDLITTCIAHEKAANETFLASDDQDLSTTELIRMLGTAIGINPYLIPIPMKVLRCIFAIIGKAEFSDRLCDSLQVDISYTRETLGWTPPYSVEHSLATTAIAYNQKINR